MKYFSLRNKLLEFAKILVSNGLVVRSWGNLSLRIDENLMLITPSGKPYEEMIITDLVLVNYHSLEYDFAQKPSSELDLHAEVYKSRKEINAVIHTHQQNASTLSTLGIEIPPIIDDQVQILGASIRTAAYAHTGSKILALNTLNALEGRMSALMANHGAVCIGRSLDEAFTACQILEKTAKIFIDSQIFGGAKSINAELAQQLHTHYLESYSKWE